MKKKIKILAAILAALLVAFLAAASSPASDEMLYLTVDRLPDGDTGGREKDGVLMGTVNAVRQELKDPGKLDFVPWARGISMLSQGRPMAMFPLLRTEEREKRYQWGGPIGKLKWGLFQLANAADKIHSLEEARAMGAVIGSFRKDPRGEAFEMLGLAVEETNSAELNADKLIHGRVDLIIFSEAALELLKRNPKFARHEFRAVVEFEPEELYIAFSRETDPEYVREWNDAFERLLQTGVIRRIWEDSGQKGITPPYQ